MFLLVYMNKNIIAVCPKTEFIHEIFKHHIFLAYLVFVYFKILVEMHITASRTRPNDLTRSRIDIKFRIKLFLGSHGCVPSQPL